MGFAAAASSAGSFFAQITNRKKIQDGQHQRNQNGNKIIQEYSSFFENGMDKMGLKAFV